MTSLCVVIPVRDLAAHLDACLAGLVPQLEAGDEVLVVDDGSSDGSGDVARRHGVRVIAGAGAGPYHARNAGVALASPSASTFAPAAASASSGK